MVRLDVLRMPLQETCHDEWEPHGVNNDPQPTIDGVTVPTWRITPHAEIATQIPYSRDISAYENLKNAEIQDGIKKNSHVEQCPLERADPLRELSKLAFNLL
jgi:hypothetical protein